MWPSTGHLICYLARPSLRHNTEKTRAANMWLSLQTETSVRTKYSQKMCETKWSKTIASFAVCFLWDINSW